MLKKLIIVIIVICLFCVSGCYNENDDINEKNGNNGNNDKINVEETVVEQDDVNAGVFKEIDKTIEERIDYLKNISDEDFNYWVYDEESTFLETQKVTDLLNKHYNTNKIKDISIVSSDIIENIVSDTFSVRVTRYFIQFKPEEEINGLKLNDEGMFSEFFFLITYTEMVEQQPYKHFLDLISSNDFTKNFIIKYALSLFQRDDRVPSNIRDEISIEYELSTYDNLISKDLYQVNKGYVFEGAFYYDNLDKIFCVMSDIVEAGSLGDETKRYILCELDIETLNVVKDIYLEGCDGLVFNYCMDGDIYFSSDDKSYVYKDGSLSDCSDNFNDVVNLSSPNNKYIATINNSGDLLVTNVSDGSSIIKLEAINDEDDPKSIVEYNGYRIIKWIDNDNLLYSMIGWEWSNGLGIINVSTNENMVIEGSRGNYYKNIIDDKLFCGIFGCYGEIDPFELCQIDLNSKPYILNKIYDINENPEPFEDFRDYGDIFNYSIKFSDDFKNLYILGFSSDNHYFKFLNYAIYDKKIVKKIKLPFINYDCYNQIGNIIIIENEKLMFYDSNNLYVIDL